MVYRREKTHIDQYFNFSSRHPLNHAQTTCRQNATGEMQWCPLNQAQTTCRQNATGEMQWCPLNHAQTTCRQNATGEMQW